MNYKKAFLALEDGSVFQGKLFGADTNTYGEVVFNTSMTGYQEMLTDPSYAGQILVPTYPLMGNYGINNHDSESRKVQVSGFVVREHSINPSHINSTSTLDGFLAEQGIPGISGVDTRAITRRLRTRGVMMGVISTELDPANTLANIGNLPSYDQVDFVGEVSSREKYQWGSSDASNNTKYHIVVSDFGVKYNILRILNLKGCSVTVVPSNTKAKEILSLKPNGVLLSPGPGDPELLDYAVESVKGLIGKIPILGICLGNQVLGRAFGAKTFKLKFGHRGGNHPVRDNQTNLVHITAQNHGYSVDPDSLPFDVSVSHTNLNDGTVEGLRHNSLPIMSIQYHSEAAPGPYDNKHLFDEFLDLISEDSLLEKTT
ncbi:MAG: glutamine-hydrolyzing carbamoyl-phosphate synthase small subunit [Chloroflexota bacterium]|nr:glutamine-hydrolyzing carbamoyl-phosphate synthase small subunit [Chloroflexota bacterium]